MLDLKKGSRDKLCQLRRATFGLKQSRRQWFKKLDMKLNEIGFKSSGEKEIIAVYVDDIIRATSSENIFKIIKQKEMTSFEMRDLEAFNYYLGKEFKQNIGTITKIRQNTSVTY